jgi:hypothetical protein
MDRHSYQQTIGLDIVILWINLTESIIWWRPIASDFLARLVKIANH